MGEYPEGRYSARLKRINQCISIYKIGDNTNHSHLQDFLCHYSRTRVDTSHSFKKLYNCGEVKYSCKIRTVGLQLK